MLSNQSLALSDLTSVEAFSLMDVHGTGRVSLEACVSFVDTLPEPPTASSVEAIYNQFDEDGSGDIDSEEFHGFCRALEKITAMSTGNMVVIYAQAQFMKLFNLVDDGQDSDGKVSKEELKMFIDMCGHELRTVSSSDVGQLLRKHRNAELDFDQFCEVMKTVIRGKSISQVVTIFENVQKQRRKTKQEAMEFFESSGFVPAKRSRSKASSDAADPPPVVTSRRGSSQKPTSDEAIDEAFTLMDSRGGGVVNLYSVVEFVESLPKPPSQSAIRKLYNQFDEDGSGDIDRDEFRGLCEGLERLTRMTTQAMCNHFTTAMYKHLFELVDEGGDGNSSVSKEELKTLLEAISPLLSNRFTPQDVLHIIREYDGELDFEDFRSVVKRLTSGKSISQVVAAFEEALRRRKAARHKARMKFETGTSFAPPESTQQSISALLDDPSNKMCFSCMEKDDKIRELSNEVALLKAALGQKEGEGRKVDLRAILEEDEFHGDLRTTIRTIQSLHQAPWYRKYPQLITPALHFRSSRRFADVAHIFTTISGQGQSADTLAREINERSFHLSKLENELIEVMDPLLKDVRQITNVQNDLLNTIRSHASAPQLEELQDQVDIASSFRMRIGDSREKVQMLLDAVVQERSRCCTVAVAAAPLGSKTHSLALATLETEDSTQELLESVVMLMSFGSEQLTDVEIVAKRLAAEAIKEASQQELSTCEEQIRYIEDSCKESYWTNIFTRTSETFSKMQKLVSSMTAPTRDKSIMTLPMTDLQPLSALFKEETAQYGASHQQGKSGETGGFKSSGPRVRTIKPKPKDTLAHVDRVLAEYNDMGIPVPPNFGRVEPQANMFYFGPTKIELIPAYQSVVVKVGGGYLLFDEYCKKYSESKERLYYIHEEKNLAAQQRQLDSNTRSVDLSSSQSKSRATQICSTPGRSSDAVLLSSRRAASQQHRDPLSSSRSETTPRVLRVSTQQSPHHT